MNQNSIALLAKIAEKKASEKSRQETVKEKYKAKAKKLTIEDRLTRIEKLLGIEN